MISVKISIDFLCIFLFYILDFLASNILTFSVYVAGTFEGPLGHFTPFILLFSILRIKVFVIIIIIIINGSSINCGRNETLFKLSACRCY